MGDLPNRDYYSWKSWVNVTTRKIQKYFTKGIIMNSNMESINNIKFDTRSSHTPIASGGLGWNSGAQTLDLKLIGDCTIQIGQETLIYVKAQGNIVNGDVIQYVTATGNNIIVKKAVAAEINIKPSLLLGLATVNISNNTKGYICIQGSVRDISTSGYADGTILYYNSTIGAPVGDYTDTKPASQYAQIVLGIVGKASTGASLNGIIFVSLKVRCRFSELQGVSITPPTENDLVQYDANGNLVNTKTINGDITYTSPLNIKGVKTNAVEVTDLTVECGAEKTIVLANPVYSDLIISAANLRVGNSPPSFVAFQDSIYATSFINGNTDIVYGSFEIQHDYKEGTALEVHLHWSPSSTNTGNCVWSMKYSKAGMAGTFGAEESLTFTQAGSGTVNKHQYVSGNVLISGTGLTIGTVILFALSRPSGDAFTGDAFLHSVGVHYQIDTMGSRTISAK